MNMMIICPATAIGVPSLSAKQPLVLAPFLGSTVLQHALSHFAKQGCKKVTLVVSDRMEQVQSVVGRGEAWGMQVEVVSAAPAETPGETQSFTLDRLPQLPEQPLWENYRGWFSAQQKLLATVARERVGMREVAPGVFVGLRSQVARSAVLTGPCWIGANVYVGSDAVVGPQAVIEDGCYLDARSEVVGSVLGSATYVGAMTEVRHSFVQGRELLQLITGSSVSVTDPFLLDDLAAKPGGMMRIRELLGRSDGTRPTWTTRLAGWLGKFRPDVVI